MTRLAGRWRDRCESRRDGLRGRSPAQQAGELQRTRTGDAPCAIEAEPTNVAPHSGAQLAEVRVSVDIETRTVTAVIEDDGEGPGANDVPTHGTVNMAFRAQRLGVSFTLERRQQGGARLTWSVPLDPPA